MLIILFTVSQITCSTATKDGLRFEALFAFIPFENKWQAKNPTAERDNKSCLLLTNCSNISEGFLAALQLIRNFLREDTKEMMRVNGVARANTPINVLWCSGNYASYIWELISLWHRKPAIRINVDWNNIYKSICEETGSQWICAKMIVWTSRC